MADRSDSPAIAGTPVHARDAGYWAFGPAGGEVPVRNAEVLLAHLPVFLAGWPFRRIAGDNDPAAAIEVVERCDGRIAIGCPGGAGAVFDDAFEAAGALADALVAAVVRPVDGLVCLRAAGIRAGSGLAVLLGGALAGKSTVALHMAAAGYRLFGEDRLALRLAEAAPDAGLCLGLNPRMRLPLPEESGPRLREYIDAFTEMRDEKTAYLKLWEGEAAGFMEEAPLAAFVLLDRQADGPCRIEAATGPDILASLENSLSPDGWTAVHLSRLSSRIPGYRLRFSSSREAASALTAALRREE